jgi:hypothetical protein
MRKGWEKILSMPDDIEPGLSFSARDLITQLVRQNGSIRGKTSSFEGPLWLRRAGYPDKEVQLSDVRELLINHLIAFWRAGLLNDEEFYRPSAEGKKVAGTKAVADAERSTRQY